MIKRQLGLGFLFLMMISGGASAQDGKSYSIKSTYATIESCQYKTDGIFIVW